MRTAALRRGTALTLGVAAGVAWLTAAPASADRHHHHGLPAFTASVLVADEASVGAPITDADLVNPWGIAFGPTTPLWVANNGTSTSTLYRNDAGPAKVPLTVSTQPLPTGVAFNPTSGFALPDGTPSRFLFDSLSGQISAWPAPPVTTTTTVVTMPGAAYTGLAVSDTAAGPRLYAADSASKLVQVYAGNWDLVGVLSDPRLPEHLTPYNVAVLGGKVYVSYALPPDAEDSPGPRGAIDVFTLGGRLLHRLVTGGPLDGPWGMAIAPASWGRLAGALLVGNEDGGHINAFDRRSGHFLGALRDAQGQPIGGDGLWGIAFGNGVIGTPEQLVIVIGTDEYQHGLVELVSPAARKRS
jgi:uncharacterized protein (TIGR03118 family)